MRNYPDLTSKYDIEEWKELNAPDWMLELLKKNPDYNSWGNGEDCMYTNKKEGWGSSQEIASVSELYGLDDLNELVNFHFQVVRNSHTCPDCDGSGLNKATKQISDDWYDFGNTGKRWCNNITDVEVEALCKAGRLSDFIPHVCFDEENNVWKEWGKDAKIVDCPKFPSAQEVNEWSKKGMGHDSINHWVATEARARHLGVYGKCPVCGGNGHIYDEEHGHLELQMWVIHPRKGASRGVLLTNIKEKEVPIVIEYLKTAAQRNADRFGRL